MEKIKVNLSYNTYNLLIHDMESFSFNLKDGIPNKNLFYNTVCCGMYEIYKQESNKLRSELYNILENKISDTAINDILNSIEQLYNYKNEDKTNRSHGFYISFRPSKGLINMYEEIEVEELKGNSISNFYRNLFNSYAKLPQDERERIVFANDLKNIESAISNKKTIIISLKNSKLELIPYKVVRTNDELYNYLITGFKRNNVLRIFSLHLFKCNNVIKSKNSYQLSKEEIDKFDSCLEYGPRYIEYRIIKTKIKLTKKGQSFFKKFYLNRPIPDSIEEDIYTFTCSEDELAFYFSRFGSHALVIEPINLKNRMKSFYKRAYNFYENS